MSIGLLSLIILVLAALGYVIGRRKAVGQVEGDIRKLHSLPPFYGRITALLTAVPAFFLIAAWLLAQPLFLENKAISLIDPAELPAGKSAELMMADVRRVAAGLNMLEARGDEVGPLLASPTALKTALNGAGVVLETEPTPSTLAATAALRDAGDTSRLAMTGAALLLALAGLAFGFSRINPEYRARNATEQFAMWLLMTSSLIAVLTTVGIVGSLLFESIHFFRLYPASEFFFSTTWKPQFGGGSSLGILPLLWGTLYVSVIALVVAVPIGLMSAIYLAEYASRSTRAWVKPAIEILAGIPTIVYGLFALITVGPLLRDYFASPLGLGTSSSSVMTAGLVMGIMVIPFVSSLSDDIINAVPQSLRDGSLGLGATPSETIKQVVIPAALPGIVGAVLLAASRAIGETMIVVLGAGAAAQLSMNPFEAMTTVTVKIVSQLTGDTEFASPETLVAFALGLTLFCLTLALNIIALVIVRKYREQYE
ncbi:phosphate ABC transporter permease subunit PstC [Cypionkella sp.]|jgi:phosphate transport system permease protein|uniref:phosphate ABC transporter permease subunit PstC n=1 Tax=Cypionkella sp. TaxID=2811411 RepID=UPI002724FBB2|nr:phosphate ABC transporter permease subunit PstC [Cypionkella sp.]MDO8983165.1 phosphate ABC transporter permease subunit PstC [Cypionkella sp.]MDP2049779.1 phosphate ABC transporter permease subunit PstC [Cypionkella sp.]